MEVIDKFKSREEYIQTQIARSEAKFHFCKVSIRDTQKYIQILGDCAGPILCLGTRNGREVDLFRIAFFGSKFQQRLVRLAEAHTHSFISYVPWLESWNRSDVRALTESSVIGVEVNPHGQRSDIHVGSFDDMPREWEKKFSIVYSNSFDQSQDPYKTAKEWMRVIKPGGYLVFCFDENDRPTETDPVGGLSLNDILKLFPGQTIAFNRRGSANGYSEAIIRF